LGLLVRGSKVRDNALGSLVYIFAHIHIALFCIAHRCGTFLSLPCCFCLSPPEFADMSAHTLECVRYFADASEA
jgi:hypothetical protein